MTSLGNVGGRVPLVRFLLRISVFLVLLMWVLDKAVNPAHAIKVFESFYGLSGVGTALVYGLGVIQFVIVLGFVMGVLKPWTYGAVLVMHGVSTLVSFRQYLDPFTGPNLLFFAAWPMLAACFALFYLRDLDTLWVLGKPAGRKLNT